MARHIRIQRKTLLAVGEGKSETAFLKHLISLYCSGGEGVKVTVRNAHGRGPGNVISTAIGAGNSASYDKKVCLLDTDIQWTAEDIKNAKRYKIELVGSTPCLEGLLLKVLCKQVPFNSAQCKQQLFKITGKAMVEASDYLDFFSKTVLHSARANVPELDKLIKLYENVNT